MEKEKLEQIASIVRSMNASGMGQEDIKKTLKAMSLSEDEISSVLDEAKSAPSNQDIHNTVQNIKEKIESGDHLTPIMPEIKKQSENTSRIHEAVEQLNEKVSAYEDHIHEIKSNVQEHKEKINEIHSAVSEMKEGHNALHEKISSIGELGEELQQIKEMLIDMKASIKALRDINQKILDTNTKFLMRLEK
mgnify:CR=1 FL=1